jgi:peptidoglycan/LPS O-acetylase OafA/YrhL
MAVDIQPTASWRGHIPALDGIRGLAIAAVMLLHVMDGAAPTGFLERGVVEVARGGWIGVDLFFVLSGFLITGILLDARGGPRYFRNFYVRRTLRIFPLYYAILIGVFVVMPLLATARGDRWLSGADENQSWFWTYTYNVLLAIEGDWSETDRLGHFWSLALEEQFYLVWPAVVLLLSPRQLRRACAAILVGALALRLAMLQGDGGELAAYALMPARADTLAAGAWVAVALRTGVPLEGIRRHARWALLASGVAIAAMFVRGHGLPYDDYLVQTIGYTCLALGFAALLALALDSPGRATVLGAAFRNPALRGLGKYSYAMYCFHPLIQDGLRSFDVHASTVPIVGGSVLPGIAAYGAVVLTLTFASAYLSWHLFEKHFLRLKDRFPTRPAGLTSVEAQASPPGAAAVHTTPS